MKMHFHVILPVRKNFDIWSGWHFFGPYMLADFIGPDLTIFCVVVWEMMDAWYSMEFEIRPNTVKRFFWIDYILDRRGFSWGDLLLGASAVLIYCVKHHLIF